MRLKMKKLRVLSIFLAIIILSSCSANDPKFIVSKWGRSVLKWEIEQTYTTDYEVGYSISVAESEDGEYEELFTIYKIDNKLLDVIFNSGGTNKYPQIRCVNYAVSNDYITTFKDQAIVGVSSSIKHDITHVYSTDVADFDKVFEFKINSSEFDISSNYDGYKLYMVNRSETMPINPLKNIVMDYSDVTYNGKDFSIGCDDYGMNLMSKIICDGRELMIKMKIAYYEKNYDYSAILDYLDSKDSFQTFTEWPDRYLTIMNSKLRNQPIPFPDGMSMYNEMVGLFDEGCELKVFLSDDEFIENYANKLVSNGFYLSPLAKGNYFKKVTSDNQEFYIHIYLQNRGEYNYIRFGINSNDRRVYDLRY